VQSVLKFFGICIFFTVAVLLAMASKDIVENWGHTVARALALGFLAGCVLYQVAHRIRHGVWYD
jgi:hypothetical protein